MASEHPSSWLTGATLITEPACKHFLFLYKKAILKAKIFYGVLIDTDLIAFSKKILKSKHMKEDRKHNNNYVLCNKRQAGFLQ